MQMRSIVRSRPVPVINFLYPSLSKSTPEIIREKKLTIPLKIRITVPCIVTENVYHQPDPPGNGDYLIIVTLSEAKCLPVSEDPGPNSEVEKPRKPEQVKISVSGGLREEVIFRGDKSLFE